MLVRKAVRYRVSPTHEQEARPLAWEQALRDARVFITAFDQIGQLRELRADLPALADVPRNVCAQLLIELDKGRQQPALQDGFK